MRETIGTQPRAPRGGPGLHTLLFMLTTLKNSGNIYLAKIIIDHGL